MEKNKKRLFFLSLTLSVSFHFLFLFCLQLSGFNNVKTEKALSKQQERDYLQTVFGKVLNQKTSLDQQKALPKPFFEDAFQPQVDEMTLKTSFEKKERVKNILQNSKSEEIFYIKKKDLPQSKLSLKEPKKNSSFNDFAKKIALQPSKKNLPISSPTMIQEPKNELLSVTLNKPFKNKKDYTFNPVNPFQSKLPMVLEKAKVMFPEKGEIDIQRKKSGFFHLADLKTKSCAEDFDVDVSYLPKEDGSGYLFALTLIPKPFVKFPKLKQNYFFIVDRSNAIGKKRFHITQSAVLRSLSGLSEKDTFNILAFDNRIELFSPHNVSYNKESLVRAKRFLDELSLGNIFTSSNITLPLYSVLSYPSKDDDINIAVLLTNGDGAASAFNNRKIVDEWSAQNNGKISLYSLVLDTDEEHLMMKMFSVFNRGKMISSSTTRGIKRKLIKLMSMIKHPIAKDVVISAISKDGKKSVELSPYLRTPHIYFNDPYVILGSTNSLDDFVLFIQAKQNGKYLNIKKNISFDRSKSASKSIKKEWVMQKAFEQYQLFLKYNDPRHLQAMRDLLSPFNINPSF